MKDVPVGVGATLPEVLRDLASKIENSSLKVWIPRPATVVIEKGRQEITCSECGAVHISNMEKVLAFVCDQCGMGVEVEE